MPSIEFTHLRDDGVTLDILLDNIDVRFEGDGYHEPESVYVEDFDICWALKDARIFMLRLV